MPYSDLNYLQFVQGHADKYRPEDECGEAASGFSACVLYPLSLGATTLPFPSRRLWLRWCHGSRQWKGRLFNVGLLFLALRPYALHIEPWLDSAHRRPPVVLMTTRSAMSANSLWPQRGSVGSASANLQRWCRVTVYLHVELLARAKGFVYSHILERFFIFIFNLALILSDQQKKNVWKNIQLITGIFSHLGGKCCVFLLEKSLKRRMHICLMTCGQTVFSYRSKQFQRCQRCVRMDSEWIWTRWSTEQVS